MNQHKWRANRELAKLVKKVRDEPRVVQMIGERWSELFGQIVFFLACGYHHTELTFLIYRDEDGQPVEIVTVPSEICVDHY